MEISLSNFLPANTAYFYCLPAGEDSNFFNPVEAWRDEIAAGRPLICAGEGIKVVCFPSNIEKSVWHLLHDEMGVELCRKENILLLPEKINADTGNEERNRLVKQGLKKITAPHQLIMTQPYIDPDLNDRYQIPPELVNYLNDKKNMPEFIDRKFLAERSGTFKNGKAFAEKGKSKLFPCVVKVSSSSAGDGVLVCKTETEFRKAQEKFRNLKGEIFIEEYIDGMKNFCVHCAIPFDKKIPIQVIGFSEQITSPEGEFLGGFVDINRFHHEIGNIEKVMIENILPKIRELGWYGPCGLDVLVRKDGSFVVIDCNFRFNATSPYLYQARNGLIQKPMVTFTGVFEGEEEDFQKKIVPLARHADKEQILNVITLMKKDGTYRFNAGMLFEDEKTKKENAQKLLSAGVSSKLLQMIDRGN